MFRLFRPVRSIFSLGSRVNPTHPPQPESYKIQHVKIHKRRIKVTDILIGGGITYVCYAYFRRSLGIVIHEAGLELTEEEEKELDEEEDSPIFIPFPGFTRTVDPPPYRSTDPEWVAFLKVSRNRALLRQIRDSLAETVRLAVVNHPIIGKRFGPGGEVSTYWFDVHYPFRPPPTFMRQGLSIGGEDGIAWTEYEVEPLIVSRTRQALWPSAVAYALWSFTGALVSQNVTSIAKFFGYEPQPDSAANIQQSEGRIQQQLKKIPGKPSSESPPPPSQERTGDGSSTTSIPPVEKRSTGSTTTPEAVGPGAGVDNIVRPVPSAKDTYGYVVRTAQEHTSGPWDKLKKTLVQKWSKPVAYPPRGSIRLSGLVEITTSRALVTVDCTAWWDPQTEAFDVKSLQMQIRAARPRRQYPLK